MKQRYPGTVVLTPPVLVIPDLHDHPQRIRIASQIIENCQKRFNKLHVVLLGDIMDRGMATALAHEWTRKVINSGQGTLLSGNHEAMAWLGSSGNDSHAFELHNIWMHNGGRTWVANMGGAIIARSSLQWIAQHAALAAEVHIPGGEIILSHARIPDSEGWELIETLQARSPGPARQALLHAMHPDEGSLRNPAARFLWGNPVEQGQPGNHSMAIHGHISHGNPILRSHAAGSFWQLDLRNPSRLACALILPDGEIEIVEAPQTLTTAH